jgi:hypothetical protein
MRFAMSGWMMWVLLFVFVGPMMRFMFWGPRHLMRDRWDWEGRGSRRSREEISRLDAEIANRDAVIDDLQRRLSEVEARLDFTERLLAERANVARLDPVSGVAAQR